MPVPLILMAAGTALQVFGQMKANQDQAQAELANARFYEQQAQFSLTAMYRQEDITSRQYESRRGAQVSAYAKGNVDLSGSAAITIAETVAQKAEELQAVRAKGELDFHLARARARSAVALAGELTDPMNNLMQAGGTVLKNFGSMKAGDLSTGGGTSGDQSMYKSHITGEWEPMTKSRTA